MKLTTKIHKHGVSPYIACRHAKSTAKTELTGGGVRLVPATLDLLSFELNGYFAKVHVAICAERCDRYDYCKDREDKEIELMEAEDG